MATWRVNNSTSLGGEVCAPWVANHAYSLGARVVCRVAYATTAARAFVYECTSAGTSHATTEPSWPTTVGNTVVDNGATWTCRSPSDGSWDNASCYLHYILNHSSINLATDLVYIDDGHSEAPDFGSKRIILKGHTTANTPTRIFCVDKADDSLSTGAVVKHNNGTYGIYYADYGYSYGVTYESAGEFGPSTTNAHWIFESDGTHDVIKKSAGSILIGYGFTGQGQITILNGGVYLGQASCYFYANYGQLLWLGGSLTAPSGVTKLFDAFTKPIPAWVVRDVDLSAVGTTNALVDVADSGHTRVYFERCKLPSGAFVPTAGSWPYRVGGKVSLSHCSSANQVYDFHESSYEGTCQDETTIVRTGGASDGTTAISCKMVSSSGCVDNLIALESPPITAWTSSTTEKTFTIEFVHDSATALQDDEIWMELEYPANNTDGLGAIAKSKCAVLGTPADTADSSETWTTTGLTNPNTRKLSVTVTPGKAGPICARVYLAKASTTVYVDPLITES